MLPMVIVRGVGNVPLVTIDRLPPLTHSNKGGMERERTTQSYTQSGLPFLIYDHAGNILEGGGAQRG